MDKASEAAALAGGAMNPAYNVVDRLKMAIRADEIFSEIRAEQDAALRELLSYCKEREVYKGRDNEIGADTAYGDVADKLSVILDGE